VKENNVLTHTNVQSRSERVHIASGQDTEEMKITRGVNEGQRIEEEDWG
jgi:hypothetical protein